MAGRRKDAGSSKDDSATLWQRVKESAAPIRRDTVPLSGSSDPKPAPGPEKKSKAGPIAPKRPSPGVLPTAVPSVSKSPARELNHGCAPGVDKRTAERLKKGRMAIEGRLDLHGMSREAAHRATVDYVRGARAAGKRCVLIVTGKGKGILQTDLPRWLNLPAVRSEILSFSHATPQDGGTGAVYVLLKRDRSR